MRTRWALTAAVAVAMLVAACGSEEPKAPEANPLDGKGKTLKVWLMVDAESAWLDVVEAANAKFKETTGGDVKVEFQQWGNHLTKLDATLAGSDVPDVVELGNTEAAKYVFNGAFVDLSDKKGSFENSSNWLTGLSSPCEADGKLYCVAYYAGARVLIYRTDLFKAANIQPPKSYDELVQAADALQTKNGAKDPKFQAFYMAGKYWYAAMSWVYGNGGQIAKKEGDKWRGTLSEQPAVDGLTKWADLVKKYSKGDKTKDENDQAAIFSQGHTAMMYGNGWEIGATESQPIDPNNPKSKRKDTVVKGKVTGAPLPGFTMGQNMPAFLGGSVLGVASKSKNGPLAAEWIKIFTSTASQEMLLAKGVLPNATNLLDKAATVKGNEATALAAKNSYFTPVAPKWADVEKAAVLQNMLVDIVTDKKSVADATKAADEQITATLNG